MQLFLFFLKFYFI